MIDVVLPPGATLPYSGFKDLNTSSSLVLTFDKINRQQKKELKLQLDTSTLILKIVCKLNRKTFAENEQILRTVHETGVSKQVFKSVNYQLDKKSIYLLERKEIVIYIINFGFYNSSNKKEFADAYSLDTIS